MFESNNVIKDLHFSSNDELEHVHHCMVGRYLVVDTGVWLSGRKRVLIKPNFLNITQLGRSLGAAIALLLK